MKVRLKSKTFTASYGELAEKVGFPEEEYFKMLRKALSIWIKIFV